MGDRLLLTGAAGFIGRELHRTLAEKGHRVSILETEESFYRNAHLVHPSFEDVYLIDKEGKLPSIPGFSFVVHCGAISDTRETDYARLHLMNVEHTKRLLQCANLNRFIFFSSAGVYGDSAECHPTRSALRPQTAYALSKLVAEHHIQKCNEFLFGSSKACIVRPFNVYGLGELTKKPESRSLVYRMCDPSDKLHRPPDRCGNLGRGGFAAHSHSARRDFIDVRDVCDAINTLIERWGSWKHTVFNIGTGVSTSVSELARYADLNLINGTNPYSVRTYQMETRAAFDEDSPQLVPTELLSDLHSSVTYMKERLK